MSKKKQEIIEVETQGSDLPQNEKIQEAIKNDPLFKFIWSFRKPLIVVLLLLVGGNYLYQRTERMAQDRRRSAALVLDQVREELSNFDSLKARLAKNDLEGTVKTNLENDVSSSKNVIMAKLESLLSEPAPYDKIAEAYKVLFFAKDGAEDKLVAFIDSFQIEKLSHSSMEELFHSEIALLYVGRKLLDSKVAANQSKAKELLKQLASKAKLVNSSAAFTLAKLVNTDEEKTKLVSIMNDIVSKEPSQKSLLSPEIERLS